MKVAAIQLCSGLDPKPNIEKIRNLLSKAKDQGVKAAFLPECFYSMSDGTKASPYLVKKGNEHYQVIQNLAKDFSLYILGGSAATEGDNGAVLNRSYNFDPMGNELGYYDKIHLFKVDLSRHQSKKVIDEGMIYKSGNTPSLIEFEGIKLGLGICFDLRFPEFFRRYFQKGANVLSVSSAFTVPTGKAHWHSLLRARAIENQSYVIASAQWGENNERIQTFGHSLIIDPWGEVLADAKEGETLIMADIDLNHVQEIRSRMKVTPDEL